MAVKYKYFFIFAHDPADLHITYRTFVSSIIRSYMYRYRDPSRDPPSLLQTILLPSYIELYRVRLSNTGSFDTNK